MIDYAERAVKYRNRAEEIRVVAEHVKEDMARSMLERAARDYDDMAQTMEAMARDTPKA